MHKRCFRDSTSRMDYCNRAPWTAGVHCNRKELIQGDTHRMSMKRRGRVLVDDREGIGTDKLLCGKGLSSGAGTYFTAIHSVRSQEHGNYPLHLSCFLALRRKKITRLQWSLCGSKYTHTGSCRDVLRYPTIELSFNLLLPLMVKI